MPAIPTPYESASLNSPLYDLRREPVLYEARAWSLSEVHSATFEDAVAAISRSRRAHAPATVAEREAFGRAFG